MNNHMFNDISNTTSTSSQGEAEIACDGGENQKNLYTREEAYQIDILKHIENRRKTSSEYLTKAQAENITDTEETVDDINRIFDDITSTLQKLLVDISLLERSRLTHDIDSNWDDLNEISDSAIDVCDRSFGEPTVSSSEFEYRLGNQVGRILASLTGKATQDQRASSFYVGLSNAYTKNDDRDYSKDYPDRSELNDQDPRAIISKPIILEDRIGSFSHETKELIRMYGYDMDLDVIHIAAISDRYLGVPLSFDKDRKALHEDVVTLLEDRLGRWFGMCVEIRSKLDKEWDEIDKAGVPGLPAKQALSELWDMTIGENRVSVESDQVAKNYKKPSYKKQVSTVFNSLSYRTKTKHTQVDKQLAHDTAVVAYDQGWKLTPYGYLLCFYKLHAGGTDMAQVALNEIAVIGEFKMLDDPVEFDRELVRQGLEQFYDMDVPKHF